MSMVAMLCVPQVVDQSAAFYTGLLVPTWSGTDIGYMLSYVPAVEIASGGGQSTIIGPKRLQPTTMVPGKNKKTLLCGHLRRCVD